MIRLTNQRTGHEVKTDERSVDFWLGAGYVRQEPVKEKPKRAPRKSASRKRSS